MACNDDDEFDFNESFIPTTCAESEHVHGEPTEKLSEVGGLTPFDESVFENLEIPKELAPFFESIRDYQPKAIKPKTKAKPFVPDYIPALGDVDDFLKIPRPDGARDLLGLTVLDEPCANQSDPAILKLKLKPFLNRSSPSEIDVSKITSDEKIGQRIDQWINTVAELQRNEITQPVVYSNRLPDVETLMERWTAEVVDLFNAIGLPDKNMEIEFETLVKLCCNLVHIPVFPGKELDSLHLLFSLLVSFQDNPYLTDS